MSRTEGVLLFRAEEILPFQTKEIHLFGTAEIPLLRTEEILVFRTEEILLSRTEEPRIIFLIALTTEFYSRGHINSKRFTLISRGKCSFGDNRPAIRKAPAHTEGPKSIDFKKI